MVNYNITYSEMVHKYLLKAFYNKINKKEYNLQIWQYNICHTNIVAIKNIIILEKEREKEKLSKDIVDITASAEMT